MSVAVIDLNCDVAEGVGNEAGLMPWISSANLACGAHAGDEATMREVAKLALHHGVAIGAHPGFADREHFGRQELTLTPDEIEALVVTQVRALQAIAPVQHVKPHGALYNRAARDPATARAIATAVRRCGADLVLVGLAGSTLPAAGEGAGLRVAHEAFADRRYEADGTLTPRSHPDALIADPAEALRQVLTLVREHRLRTRSGDWLSLRADTVCLHGDGPGATELARHLRTGLADAGVRVASQRP